MIFDVLVQYISYATNISFHSKTTPNKVEEINETRILGYIIGQYFQFQLIKYVSVRRMNI